MADFFFILNVLKRTPRKMMKSVDLQATSTKVCSNLSDNARVSWGEDSDYRWSPIMNTLTTSPITLYNGLFYFHIHMLK